MSRENRFFEGYWHPEDLAKIPSLHQWGWSYLKLDAEMELPAYYFTAITQYYLLKAKGLNPTQYLRQESFRERARINRCLSDGMPNTL